MSSYNSRRADEAMVALTAYEESAADVRDSTESSITDLIVNLLHLAAQRGLDAETMAGIALTHWQSEHNDPEFSVESE